MTNRIKQYNTWLIVITLLILSSVNYCNAEIESQRISVAQFDTSMDVNGLIDRQSQENEDLLSQPKQEFNIQIGFGRDGHGRPGGHIGAGSHNGHNGHNNHGGYDSHGGHNGHGGNSGHHNDGFYPPDQSGITAAGRVCRRLFLDRDQMTCMDVVHRARFFSDEAVKVCGGLYLDNDKIRCLNTISDRMISRDDADFCGNQYLDRNKIDCLGRLSGYNPPHPQMGIVQAKKVCSGLYLDRDQMNCMDVVHRARFFSDEAVKVCGGLYLDNDKIRCLNTISDRMISRDDADFCRDKYLDNDKIECLRRFSH